MFSGSLTALVTPFKEGALDKTAFCNLVERQIKNGTHGLVPCGTTGETPTLTFEEYLTIIRLTVQVRDQQKDIPVLAGSGTNSTLSTIERSLAAEKAGADGLLIVSPYYNKPTQEGIFQHFKAVHDATTKPIILYNVPSRTGGHIEVETVIRLAKECKKIVGIKDATEDLSRPLALRTALGESFLLLSGEDATVAAFLAQGGNGCISVTANVAPKECALLHEAWQKQDKNSFEKYRNLLLPLHQVMFFESNPTPAKYALSKLGLCEEALRLPLLPATRDCRLAMDSVLEEVFGAPLLMAKTG